MMKYLSSFTFVCVLVCTATVFVSGCAEEPIIEEYVPPKVAPLPPKTVKEKQLESRWAAGERDEK